MTRLALLLSLIGPARAAGPGAAFVAEVEDVLWNDHVDVRNEGYVLARAGLRRGEIVEELCGILAADPDPGVRARAALLLGRVGLASPRALKALRAAGSDRSELVSSTARGALIKFVNWTGKEERR